MQVRPMMFPVAKPDKFLDRPGEPVIDFETWMGLFESYMDACLLQGVDDTSMMGYSRYRWERKDTGFSGADLSNVDH